MEVSLWDMKRIFVMQGPYKVLVMAMLFINLKRAVSLVFDNYLCLIMAIAIICDYHIP